MLKFYIYWFETMLYTCTYFAKYYTTESTEILLRCVLSALLTYITNEVYVFPGMFLPLYVVFLDYGSAGPNCVGQYTERSSVINLEYKCIRLNLFK
jgi:hypothetical protein